MAEYILALDQGTTSSRAILFDEAGSAVASAQKEVPQIFPRPGWVEHNPMDILATQTGVAAEDGPRRRFPTGSAHTDSNLMPPIRDAANAYATVDEASCRPRSAFGEYRDA